MAQSPIEFLWTLWLRWKNATLAVDINNDGHLDLVYIDQLGFGQTKSGVVAIKLGPFGYPHFNMLSWSSILDAEY